MEIADNLPPPVRRAPVDISVIIPSYNHAKYILEAIDSVERQTFSNWELIIVDDGSTDDSVNIIKAVVTRNRKVSGIFQGNRGAHNAINRGISLASGKYVCILNSDDRFHPDRLARLFRFSENAGVQFAITAVRPIDTLGNEIQSADHPWNKLYGRLRREYQAHGALPAMMTGNFAITSSNFFFRIDLFTALHGFAAMRYNHDWDFAARAIHQFGDHFLFLDSEPLLDYRIHPGNTIDQNPLLARLEMQRLFCRLGSGISPIVGHLLSRSKINQRSIRREYHAVSNQALHRLLADYQLKIDELRHEIDGLQSMKAQDAMQIEQLSASLDNLNAHITAIQSSRSYRWARKLADAWRALRH